MRIYISILIVLILLSCKKTGLNYVKGTVYEEITGEPVKGAVVYLYKDPNRAKRYTIAYAVTDEKGEYKISYSHNLAADYYVSCRCNNYYEKYVSLGTELKKGKTAFNFYLSPYSFVILRFIKTGNLPHWIDGGIDDATNSFISPRTSTPYPGFKYDSFDITEKPMVVGANKMHTIKWMIAPYDTSFGSDGILSNYPNRFTFLAKKGDTLKYTFNFN
jgi:hypothetical protein